MKTLKRDQLIEIILTQILKQGHDVSDMEHGILGTLDSIELVNFIMDLEEELSGWGSFKLMSDKAFGASSPFRSVQTLADFILGET